MEIADKALSALLARDLLVPIVHTQPLKICVKRDSLTWFAKCLSAAEDSMADVAAKLVELVNFETMSD